MEILAEKFMKKLVDLYSVEGARSIFETITALILRNSDKVTDLKSIRVHKGDGGVDSFEGTYGGEVKVFQCKFFIDGIKNTQKKQIKDSFQTAIDNANFNLTDWILCIPLNMSEKEEKWFSGWKNEMKKEYPLVSIDYLAEDYYREELIKEENCHLKNEYFHHQTNNILHQIKERLDLVSPNHIHEHGLYNKILEKFDEDRFYNFTSLLESNQFANSENITHYYDFIDWVTKPSRSFLDQEVQHSLSYFVCEIEKVLNFISSNFFFKENETPVGVVFLAPQLKVNDYNKFKELREYLYKLCEDLKYYYEVFTHRVKQQILT